MNIGQRHPRHINSLCSLLGYSRQAFYQFKHSSEKTALNSELILQEVLNIRKTMPRLGGRKILIKLEPFLAEHKITMGRDVLFDLLAANGLLIRTRKRKVPRTTFSDHWYRKYPNLIVDMPVLHANRLWVSDITYIRIAESFGYLSLITDAYSRMVVGHHLSTDLAAAGCIKALTMALKKLPATHSLIHHSDRGVQYCCTDYVEHLLEKAISVSMTQRSDPRDNSIAERMNGILKQELLQTKYSSYRESCKGVKAAIDIYNYERPHSSIDMLTPSKTHSMEGHLKRRWKNYYKCKKQKEGPMDS